MKITIETSETNPFKIATKQKQLQELAILEEEILDKLVKLKRSVKALNYIKYSWDMLQRLVT